MFNDLKENYKFNKMLKTQLIIRKKKKTRYFESYIYKILKKISNTNGITSNAKQQLNSVICFDYSNYL